MFWYPAAFQQVIDDSSNTYSASFEPGLFCDESWQYLTHLEIDTTTGGFTGRTISEKSNGKDLDLQVVVIFLRAFKPLG